jgi:hypothetical protein
LEVVRGERLRNADRDARSSVKGPSSPLPVWSTSAGVAAKRVRSHPPFGEAPGPKRANDRLPWLSSVIVVGSL